MFGILALILLHFLHLCCVVLYVQHSHLSNRFFSPNTTRALVSFELISSSALYLIFRFVLKPQLSVFSSIADSNGLDAVSLCCFHFYYHKTAVKKAHSV